MRKSRYLIAMMAVATGVALLGQAGRVIAGPWDMDTTYGQGGFVAGASWEMIGRPGGSLLRAMSTSIGTILERFDSNGVQDPLFGSAGQLEITFPAGFESRDGSIPEIDAAGRYLWCGRTDRNGDGVGDLAILRVTATGIPDPGFGEGGVMSRMTDPLPAGGNKYGNWCQSLAIQPDGRIVAGIGHANLVPGEGSSVRRFNSDGSDDASFGGTGRVGVSAYNYPEVQVLPNGWIYVKTNDGYGDNVADNLIDPTGLPGPKPWADLPRDVYWWQTYSSMVSGDVFLVGQDNNGKLIVARLSPGGTLDKSFGGAGTGFVTIDPHPSPAVAVVNDCCTGGYSFRLSQDGQRMYLAYSHHGSDGQVSGEIGRIHVAGILAGQRDESFGVHGSIPFALPYAGGLWEQSPGDLLVAVDGAVFRLSAASGRSPGIIGFRTTSVPSRYGNTPTITVGRYAGDDGTVSISYRTIDSTTDDPRIYEPTSGQLQWADGDSAEKSFSVRVLPQLSAVSKGFDLLLENPVGGALTQNSQVNVWVTADTPPPVLSQPIVPAPPSATTDNYRQVTSGGGSTDLWSLLLLLLGGAAAMRARVGNRMN